MAATAPAPRPPRSRTTNNCPTTAPPRGRSAAWCWPPSSGTRSSSPPPCPRKSSPRWVNRYRRRHPLYGAHVDNAIRFTDTGERVRTDVSCTVFLADPDEYDGGELPGAGHLRRRGVKLPAGHAVLYPGTSVHQVTPVTRGAPPRLLLLDRKHGAQRRAAPPAVRHGHGLMRLRERTAKPPKPWTSPARTTTCCACGPTPEKTRLLALDGKPRP
jgi:hypothetical protein